MITGWKQKWKSQSGETMMEALVACLIAAIALSMIAQVMVAAAHATQQSRAIQEKNEALMDAFWQDTKNGNKVDAVTASFTDGSSNAFTVSAGLYAQKVTAKVNGDDCTGTVYEFQPDSSGG